MKHVNLHLIIRLIFCFIILIFVVVLSSNPDNKDNIATDDTLTTQSSDISVYQTDNIPISTSSDVVVPVATSSDAVVSDIADSSTESIDTFDAKAIVAQMSMNERIAQMFWVRCPDYSGDYSLPVTVQTQYQFGGYILFDRDFRYETAESVADKINSYQECSNIPMLIGVDEEGGTVCRISHFSQYRDSAFLSPRDLYASGGMPLVESTEEEKAILLSSLGINVNLAPVCDLSTNPADYMYERSFGGTPAETGEYVSNIITINRENGLGTVMKHFPGYGNNSNTHTSIVVDNRDYNTFLNNDLVPFSVGIEAGCGCILISHNIINCIDPEYPASLSVDVHKLLRNELGFNGVIMTDDLAMRAITQYTNGNEAIVQAILAGNDLLCVDFYATQYPAVVDAVNNGTIPKAMINESVIRILNWKHSLDLIF